jgi:hypothetical protein
MLLKHVQADILVLNLVARLWRVKNQGRRVGGKNNILSRKWVTNDGARLVIRFTEHLQIVTTSKYSAITNSHTLHFSKARIESSQSAVFTGRCLVTASNAVDPSTSVLMRSNYTGVDTRRFSCGEMSDI